MKPPPRLPARKPIRFEALEPRVLFSAVPLDPAEAQGDEVDSTPIVQDEAPFLHDGAETSALDRSDGIAPESSLSAELLDPAAPAGSTWTLLGTENLEDSALLELEEAFARLQASLLELGDGPEGEALLREVFGKAGTDGELFDARLRQLLAEIGAGGFGATFEIRSGEELGGAMAAYAAVGHTGEERIYLNADWLHFGAGSAWIHQVLLEEVGHAIDTRLNQELDSPGDEGELFAARMLGWEVDEARYEAIRSDHDHAVLVIDGVEVAVQFASYTFANSYRVHTDPVNGTAYPADKEQNRHHFVYESLNLTRIDDLVASRFFVGNDVVVQLTVDGEVYYGWISRPIKAGGVVRGFYFWSDVDFTTMATATADGNTDGDRDFTDNVGFILVVDQAYFDGLAAVGTADGNTIKYANSSSDPVDKPLNALVGPNLAPTPANDLFTVLEDSVGNTGNVLANDTDPNYDDLTVVAFQVGGVAGTLGEVFHIAGVGEFTLQANGNFTFTPAPDYAGAVPLVSYTVSDGELQASATLAILITPVNDAPSGADKTITATQNLPYTFAASDFGFSDPRDHPANALFSVVITTLPGAGTLALDGAAVTAGQEILADDLSKLTFTPGPDENGPGYASFTFQVRDDGGTGNGGVDLDPDPKIITIDVTAVNRAPVANADSFVAVEAGGQDNGTPGSDATGNVLDNDTDPDIGDTLEVVNAGGAGPTSFDGTTFTVVGLYGTLTLGSDGNFVYAIDNEHPEVQALRSAVDTLSETFQYAVADSGGLVSSSTLTITIEGANDAPVAVDDYNVAKESLALSDPYSPGDSTGFVAVGNLLANDLDVDGYGETATLIGLTATATGSTFGVVESTLVFSSTASSTFNNVSVGYFIFLDNGGSPIPLLTSGGSQITVTSKTANPDGTYSMGMSGEPAASLTSGTVMGFANNTAGTGGTYRTAALSVLTTEVEATTEIDLVDVAGGIAVGMSVAGIDTDGVAYSTTVTAVHRDGAGNVTRVSLADPLKLSGAAMSFSAAAGSEVTGRYGTLVISADGSYLYTPFANNPELSEGESGVERFTYMMEDAEGSSSSADLVITVLGSGSNDPVAHPDTLLIDEDTTGSGNVLDNDEDADAVVAFAWNGVEGTLGEPLTLEGVGTLTLDADGSFLFVPAQDYYGAVPLVHYVASNAYGLSASTLQIEVAPVNDAPVANDDTAYVYEAGGYDNGTPGADASGNVLLNDTDVDTGDILSVAMVEAGAILTGGALAVAPGSTSDDGGTVVAGLYGTLWIGSDGSYTYLLDNGNAAVQALNLGDTLEETFVYLASDLEGATDSATLTITIHGANDAPTLDAPSIPYEGNEGESIALAGLTVADVDDDELTVVLSVNSGTLTLGSTTGILLSGSNGAATLEISGTVAAINAALATLSYVGDPDFSGTDSLSVETSDAAGLLAVASVDLLVAPDDRPLEVNGTRVNESSPFVLFEVVGVEGQKVTLEIGATGSGEAHATPGLDFVPQLEYFDGSDWNHYDGSPVAVAAGGTLLVRAAVLQDDHFEGEETLLLTATNKAGGSFSGASTIVDDGTGSIYLASTTGFDPSDPGDSGYPEYLDDDRTVSVNDIVVNESSPYAFFTVTGSPGQIISLDLAEGTATYEDFGPDLEVYLDGDWVAYVPGSDLTLDGDPLLVRTPIIQDDHFEGQETFYLVVTRAASGSSTLGAASIYDDGTGDIYLAGSSTGTPSDPGDGDYPAGLDDDRSLAVDSPDVNEGSDHVIFTLTGDPGQSVSLKLIDESEGDTVPGKAHIDLEIGGLPNLEIFAGFDHEGEPIWEVYDEEAALPTFDADGRIFVRVNIVKEQDDIFEGPETFRLEATLAGHDEPVSGTATIYDDGTAVKYPGGIDPDTGTPVTSTEDLDNDWRNSAPVLSVEDGASDEAAIDETNSGLTAAGTLTLSDIDTGDAVTVSVVEVDASGTLAGLGSGTAELLAMLSVQGGLDETQSTAAVTWSFDSGSEAFDYLGVGQSLVLTYTLRAFDGTDESDDFTLTITINGSNDIPTLSLEDPAGSITEDVDVSGGLISTSGALSIGDLDANAVLSVSSGYLDGSASWTKPDPDDPGQRVVAGTLSPAQIEALAAGTFTANETAWSYSVENEALQFLAAGESIVLEFEIVVTDEHGASASETVTLTVHGANDAPIAVGTIATQANDDSETVSLDVSAYFADPDASDVLTYSDGGTLPPGLSIDPDTGIISGTLDSSASAGGPYAVVITATDPHGATATQDFEWDVDNPAPLAVDNDFAANEDDGPLVVGNALDNDSDPDGDALSALPQTDVAGSNGGLFSIAADGEVTFDPNGEFEDLAPGETRTTSFTYTLVDADGATDTATVTVIVTGQNDAPIAVGTIATQANDDSETVSLDVSAYFADPDASDELTYSATGLPPGLSIDPDTGVISGTLDSSASVGGPYSVVVTATDPHGASVTQSFEWAVANPAPLAVDDDFAANEDDGALVVGNALDNDSDPDGDALSAVPQTDVAGSNGGLFSIAANGEVTFDPNGEFEDLALGETRTTSFTYTLIDADGATDTATITVTVTGQNDAPVAVGTIATQANDDSETVSLDVSGYFADPDASDDLTYSATGLPPGLSIDPDTGVISGTLDSSASTGGPYAVVITATDPHGATATQDFEWDVDNPAPLAVDDFYFVGEKDSAAVVGNALDNDSDPDRDALSVVPQNGVAGSAGGYFSIAEDGTVTFDPAGEFGDLGSGETRDTSFVYTLVDADGGTSEAIVTVTVAGVNDAPVADSGRIRVTVGSRGGTLGLQAPTDPDNDPLIIRVTRLPRVGTLRLGSQPVEVGQVLSAGQLQRLVYDAPSDSKGRKRVVFRYSVSDGQVTTHARVDIRIVKSNATASGLCIDDRTRAQNQRASAVDRKDGPAAKGRQLDALLSEWTV